MGRREGETNSGQLKVPGLGWAEVWLCALAKPFDSLQEAGEAIPAAPHHWPKLQAQTTEGSLQSTHDESGRDLRVASFKEREATEQVLVSRTFPRLLFPPALSFC